MKQSKLIYYFFGIIAISLAACKKSDSPNNNNGGTAGEGKFVIAALPNSTGGEGANHYLFTTDDLESGTLSTKGDGIEQDGIRSYITSKNMFFTLLYGGGEPGSITTYKLNEQGQLAKTGNTIPTESMRAFTPADDDILMFKIAGDATTENANWYKLNTTNLSFNEEGVVNVKSLSGNGESAAFTGIKQAGNKIFAPFQSIVGTESRGWGTDFPDSSWIAVYSYPEMQLEKVIRDNRTSQIGVYFTNALEVVENGDVYAWSSPVAVKSTATGGEVEYTSTKPCAIVKINAGTTEYDQSYFFDITKASGGSYIYDHLYLGNGNFILFMSDEKGLWGAYITKFAIANVNDQSFKWVTGVPDSEKIESVSYNNYSPLDGKTGFIGITTTDGQSMVYKFDAETGAATPGLKFSGATISSINWLPAE